MNPSTPPSSPISDSHPPPSPMKVSQNFHPSLQPPINPPLDLDGVENNHNLVVDLSLYPNFCHSNIESQPIYVVSNDDDETSVDTLPSNYDEENVSNSSNLEVNNEKSLWAEKSISKEEKIWNVAKLIGVSGEGSDELYIKKIKEMEARDKACKGKKETLLGAK